MRRDVFIRNDSGGFSVVAGEAVDDIIEDGRADDMRFVTGHKALLLELYGDDSMPVRVVADEPLGPEEEAQWLARASWRIDTSDGRLLLMGASIRTSSPTGRIATPVVTTLATPWRR